MNSPFKNILVGKNYQGIGKEASDDLDAIEDEFENDQTP